MPTTRVLPKSGLLLPDPAMAGCIIMGVSRNTCGSQLAFSERFNHFFTSPYCVTTWIFEGQCHLIGNEKEAKNPQSTRPMDAISVFGPNSKPLVTWNPGEVKALAVAFYPDAWVALTGVEVCRLNDRVLPLHTVGEGAFFDIARKMLQPGKSGERMSSRFGQFQGELGPLWAQKRSKNAIIPNRLTDWITAKLSHAVTGEPGRSLRQIQRRLKMATGHSGRELKAFGRAEKLFMYYFSHRKGEGMELSQMAQEAGYSDQSHMGREVRRITGFSSKKIDQLIATEEQFWCYRLMEKYYGSGIGEMDKG